MRGWGRRLAVGLLVCGVLVSGCGGSGGTEDTGGEGLADAPLPGRPDGGAGNAAPDEQAEDEAAQRPSMRSTFALDVDTASYGYARTEDKAVAELADAVEAARQISG